MHQEDETSSLTDETIEDGSARDKKVTSASNIVFKTNILSDDMASSLIDLLETKMNDDSQSEKNDSRRKRSTSSHLTSDSTLLKDLYIPSEAKAYLDRFILGQEEAKKRMAIVLCDHLNYIRHNKNNGSKTSHYVKQNVLLHGPSGSGKTYMIKCLAEFAKIPFIKSDATKFTESGYIGSDVEDTVRQLYDVANEDKEWAEMGVVFLDEIDKIAARASKLGRDVGGRGVQSSLLKLLEETDVVLKPAWDMQSQIKSMMKTGGSNDDTINTKNILFIGSGVFEGIDEIAHKRVIGSHYGFLDQDRIDREKSVRVESQDFISFGFETECIGRFPVQIGMHELSKHQLYEILKYSEGSIINHYVETFSYYNIELEITDCAMKKVAEYATHFDTGARALNQVFETCLSHLKYDWATGQASKRLIDASVIQSFWEERL